MLSTIDIISTLPYDICEYISHFLSDNDLSTLRTINQTFNDLFLLRRYRNFTLFVHWLENVQRGKEIRGFKISSGPFSHYHLADLTVEMVHRIRALRLIFKHGDAPGMLNIWRDQEQDLRNLSPPEPRSPAGYKHGDASIGGNMAVVDCPLYDHPSHCGLDQITDIICRLIQLEELTILLYGLEPSKATHASVLGSITKPFIPFCLISPASTLRALEVSVPPEAWHDIFSPSLHLRNLEKLTIHFHQPLELTSESLLNSDILLPFLQRHSKSLRNLRLVHPYCAFYTNFPTLLSLRTIDIEETLYRAPTEPNEVNIHSFLKHHRAMLTHIIWEMSDTGPHDSILVRTPWFNLRYLDPIYFPNLRALELKVPESSGNPWQHQRLRIRDFQPVLRRYCQDLTKLCLGGYELPSSSEWLEAYSKIIASRQLQHLEIFLTYLSPYVFSTMALYLPYLQILRLTYRDIEPLPVIEDEGHFGGKGLMVNAANFQDLHCQYFASNMRLDIYYCPDWNLRELYLDPVNMKFNTWRINCAVIRNIPSLFTINDIPVDEYLDDGY